jgi:ArsR family transcriptional regulator
MPVNVLDRDPGRRQEAVVTQCCGIGTKGGLDRAEAEASAALLKALANPVRLQLLSFIRESENAEACVCDLTPAVELSQPTVSHHLKVLADAGLVTREKRGTWAWFRLVPERLEQAAAILR